MNRPDKIFGHRLWMTPIASYVGFFGMLYGTYLLFTGASLWWLAGAGFCTFWILMGVTVGMHRLFAHRAFKTSKFWHVIFGYLGTIAFYGSTVQWCAMHASHHQFSDTPKDPHYTGWRYLFWKKNNPTIFNKRVLTRLYRDDMHRWLHSYYIIPTIITCLVLGLISTEALVFLYLIPLGWLHFVGSAHQVFAHDDKGPLDQKYLEIFLFTGGEWLHKHHHEFQKDWSFGDGDIGKYVVKLIAHT